MRLKSIAVLIILCGASLGCWSSNTLFIHLTATPQPTALPPTQDAASLYQVGESVVITPNSLTAVYLTQKPEPQTRRNRVPNAACYPNTTVEINAVQVIDGVTYYQITCNNTPGWVTEDSLTLP